jgi:hypothetical protein
LYTQDSFFTLTYPGQVGLVMLSLSQAACFLWFAISIGKRTSRPGRILISIGLFALFVWLTPQVYYAYYSLVLKGLPLQWVLKSPPTPTDLGRLLTFTGSPNLSAHSKGALGWLLLIIPQLVTRQSKRPSEKSIES